MIDIDINGIDDYNVKKKYKIGENLFYVENI